MSQLVLDTSGLICPLPILKAKKAMAKLGRGDVLLVIATDPGSVADFEVFCTVGGHQLKHQSDDDGVFRFEIERG